MSASTVIGIDLGGTNLRAVVTAMSAQADEPIRPDLVVPAPTGLEELRDVVRQLIGDAGGRRSVERIGLTIPGLVEGGHSTWVPNLPYLDGVDLRSGLGIDVEFVAGNDAQLAMLAECVDGAAAGLSDALLVAIGTGIGSSVLAAGRIVRGRVGGACSLGWASLDPADDGDDRHGWLERQAGGRAFEAMAAMLGFASVPELFDAARHDDPGAVDAISDAAVALGTVLGGAVALLDPQAILLVGGAVASFDVLEPMVGAAISSCVPPHLRGISIVPGVHGDGAGLRGAVEAARRGDRWWEVR